MNPSLLLAWGALYVGVDAAGGVRGGAQLPWEPSASVSSCAKNRYKNGPGTFKGPSSSGVSDAQVREGWGLQPTSGAPGQAGWSQGDCDPVPGALAPELVL